MCPAHCDIKPIRTSHSSSQCARQSSGLEEHMIARGIGPTPASGFARQFPLGPYRIADWNATAVSSASAPAATRSVAPVASVRTTGSWNSYAATVNVNSTISNVTTGRSLRPAPFSMRTRP